MYFKEYEALIEKTAIYPGKGDNLVYTVLGLNGEAGEVAEKLKKVIRDRHGAISAGTAIEFAKELGDVLWYLTACALEIGYSLDTIAAMNADKLLDRLDRNVLGGSGDNR